MAARVIAAALIAVAAGQEALSLDDECAGEEQCALNALQRRGEAVSALEKTAEAAGAPKCESLQHPSNNICRSTVEWAHRGGKYDRHGPQWFADMQSISGVDYHTASLGDWQKLYFCAPPGGKQCGSPPCTCTHPPCDVCFQGKSKAKCSDPDSIACKPPATALDYNGMAWEDMNVSGTGPFHVFAIGDWGGLDGTLHPIEGRPNLIAYPAGTKAGPSVFPRTRFNKRHTQLLCNHKQFVECYKTMGRVCNPGCGFVKGIDDQPQLLVASSFKSRAAKVDPVFILNVGDNFYWGGIEKTCGTPMDELSYVTHHQFDQVFENIYNGPGLDGKPWLSVLGNHDWGGLVFNNGWDQQIAYTWHSDRWRLPAAYWSQHVNFVDAGFTMDIFMVDSNSQDAEDPPLDPEHNICGSAHNPPGANCASQGGPTSVATCKAWFWALWRKNQEWLTEQLSKSTADWQLAVTHFPCGFEKNYWAGLHQQHGLDLLVTGHRHDQELWSPNRLGGLTCFVTGGGGGISSEATPNIHNKRDWYGEAQYGFYDLLISKTSILITSINWNGYEIMTRTVYPKA